MALTKVSYAMINGDPINVLDYGAVGDGLTDVTTAIQNAVNAGNSIYFPDGSYLISSKITLKSNLELNFGGNAKLVLKSGVITEHVLYGTTLNNIRFNDMVIEGNGLQGVTAVELVSCTNVWFQNCKITKAGTIAINLTSCTNVNVNNCDLSNNYFYGIQDKLGTNNKFIGNRFYKNGDTGVATSTGGRGIVLWMTNSDIISENSFIQNTEYGFRFYSQTGDAGTTYNNNLVNNYFEDNVKLDIIFTEESVNGYDFVYRNIVANNNIKRTVDPTLGASIQLCGSYNNVSNTHVYKIGTFGTFTAFNIYGCFECIISDCSAQNTAQALSFPTNKSISNKCVVDNFLGGTVANAATILASTQTTIKNSIFYHGGGGVSDDGINVTFTSGPTTITNCYLDGFNTAIYIVDGPVTLINNTTLNSGFAGLRKGTNSMANQTFVGNSWDVTAPAVLAAVEKTVTPSSRATCTYNAAPLNLTWAVGDKCYNNAPAVGQPIGWVCTVAGTPGTWVAMANL
jgi:hypothetical protein